MASLFNPFQRTVWKGAPFGLPWCHPALDLLPGRHGYACSSSKEEDKQLHKASAEGEVMADKEAVETKGALQEAMDALRSLGYTHQKVGLLVDKKTSLLVRVHKLILPKAAFFQSQGINSNDFFNAVKRSSLKGNFLTAPDEKQQAILEFLRGSVKVKNLGKVVGTMPGILGSRLQTLEAKARLWEELGVPVTSAMVESYPNLLTYRDETIREGVEAVRSTFSREVGEHVLRSFPCIVKRKGDHFKDAVAGLEENFGPEIAQKMLQRNPQILFVSRTTMENTYKQLEERFGKLPTLKMVQAQPFLLGRCWDSIETKVDFLLTEMGRSKEEVSSYPTTLMLSLDKRLKLRYKVLVKVGIEHHKYRLGTLFIPSNATFMKMFKVQLPQQRM